MPHDLTFDISEELREAFLQLFPLRKACFPWYTYPHRFICTGKRKASKSTYVISLFEIPKFRLAKSIILYNPKVRNPKLQCKI